MEDTNKKEYSQKIIDDLRFLTFPGTFNAEAFLNDSESDGRYDKYASYMEDLKLTLNDILSIRDFFLISDLKINEVEDLENFLLDLFASKNNGSLTCSCDGYALFKDNNYKDKYEKLFCFKNINDKIEVKELSDPTFIEYVNGLNNPIVIYEDENKKAQFAGFQKYIKAFIFLKVKLKNFLDENETNYNKIDITAYKNALNNTIAKLNDPKPCPEQCVAIATSMVNKSFSVITGGPGTGKTTVVFSLIQALMDLEKIKPEDICLMAPTGRAATRLKESIEKQAGKKDDTKPKDKDPKSIESSTIHKFLGKINIDYNIKPAKTYKLVIVDEVSMVDVYLMASLLLKFDPKETRVVLVGDVNQLPSVDTGCVLHDIVQNKNISQNVIDMVKQITEDNIFDTKQENGLCPSMPCEFISDLRYNHRSNKEELNKVFVEIEDEKELSLKIINQRDIFSAEGPNFIKMTSNDINLIMNYLENAYFNKDEDLKMSYVDFVNDISEKITWSSDINKDNIDDLNLLFNHINKYRVLCPKRNGIYGSDKINKLFYDKYSREVGGGSKYPNGMGVMVIRNDYKNQIFNGDIGIILQDKNHIYKVIFKVKDKYEDYSLNDLLSFENAFAMTIHKSQGSEYDNVFIPIESKDEKDEFLTKELIYTGVTRAKKSFIILSNIKTLNYMCKNKINRCNHLSLY